MVPSSLEMLAMAWKMSLRKTYNLGFFLGPGLPLGFGWPSTVRETFLLVPGAGIFRFFVGSPLVVASVPGAGVELDSEAASVEASTLSVGMSAVAAGGVGASGA